VKKHKRQKKLATEVKPVAGNQRQERSKKIKKRKKLSRDERKILQFQKQAAKK